MIKRISIIALLVPVLASALSFPVLADIRRPEHPLTIMATAHTPDPVMIQIEIIGTSTRSTWCVDNDSRQHSWLVYAPIGDLWVYPVNDRRECGMTKAGPLIHHFTGLTARPGGRLHGEITGSRGAYTARLIR
jgi:hypothetical protein